MANMSLRGLDERVLLVLKRRAAAESISLNTLVVRLIEEATGLRAPSYGLRRHQDMEDLIGTWSDNEFAEFAANTAIFNQIDAELWGGQR